MNQIVTESKPYDVTEFILGQQACKNGKECPEDASESFAAGFGADINWQK